MMKRLIQTPDGVSLLEIETAGQRRHQFRLPSTMSAAARMAFLASPRLAPVLGRLEQDRAEEAQGYVVFALHKLAMDLMLRYPPTDLPDLSRFAAERPTVPLARLHVWHCSPSAFLVCTSYLNESSCRELQMDTLQDALSAALVALPAQAVAIEVAYEGIVAGTYARPFLENQPEQVAAAALQTQRAIEDACGHASASRHGWPGTGTQWLSH